MSVTSGFFNSVNHDRRYNAAQMSAIFDGIINDGVFANIGSAFAVTVDTGVTVNVAKGRAWFNSAWVYNDAPLPKTLEGSEVVLDRIDAVVIEVDHNENVRLGDIKIIKGTPSSSPKRPAMVNQTNKHQYPLAYIYRKAGSTKITQADITNMVGTSSCPYITGILQVQNIDNIVAQWNAQWNEWYAEKVAETDSDASVLLAEMKSEFDIWFADFKSVLDDDVATSLAAQVADLMSKFDTLAREGAVYDTIEDSDLDEILGSDGTPIHGKTVLSSGGNDAALEPTKSDLDMNNYRILNIAEPVSDADAANAGYVKKMTSRISSPRNLLDNSDFTNPVNQRGADSYSGSGYTIDRWFIGSTNTVVDLLSGYIRLGNKSDTSANAFSQFTGKPLKVGSVYTFAIKELNGPIYVGHAEVPSKGIAIVFTTPSGVSGRLYTPDSNGNTKAIIRLPVNTSISIEWAALYEGTYTIETLPEYHARGYGAEFAECKRYYIRIGDKKRNTVLGTCVGYSASGAYFGIPGVSMRDTYTINMVTDISTLKYTKSTIGNGESPTSITQYNAHAGNSVAMSITGTFDSGEPYSVWLVQGVIEISADILVDE